MRCESYVNGVMFLESHNPLVCLSFRLAEFLIRRGRRRVACLANNALYVIECGLLREDVATLSSVAIRDARIW